MSLDDDSIYDAPTPGNKGGKSWRILHDVRRRRLWKRACRFRENAVNALIRRELLRGGQNRLDKMAAGIASGWDSRTATLHYNSQTYASDCTAAETSCLSTDKVIHTTSTRRRR